MAMSPARKELSASTKPQVSTPGGMNALSDRMPSYALTPISPLICARMVSGSKKRPPSTR